VNGGGRPERTVLFLSHRFPPIGGAGVQRITQLSRYLPAEGYLPLVVTGPGIVDDRWTPVDDELSGGVEMASVRRLAGPEPRGTPIEARLERWLRIRTRWEKWWSKSVLDLLPAFDGGVDLVHASVAPYSTAGTAVEAARRLGRPLVVDLEDPWALDEMLVYPSRWHRGLEEGRMARSLRGADVVVMNAPEARRRVLEAFRLPPDRVVAIPNAYDPADFSGPAPDRDDGRFRIVHTGSLHTDLGLAQRSSARIRQHMLGGGVPEVDLLTRSHVYLLEALGSLFERRPELEAEVEVVFAGVYTPEDRAVAARYPFVQLRDFVPHAETVALLRSADLLFLPMYDLPEGRRAGLVPQKTYEYLAAGPPILAAVPDGDARDLLAASGVALICRPRDTEAMAQVVLGEFERRRSGAPRREASPDVLSRCSCERLVRDMVALYDAVAARVASG
jgi:glycosyltransferase involved in cell wall biosynthesis